MKDVNQTPTSLNKSQSNVMQGASNIATPPTSVNIGGGDALIPLSDPWPLVEKLVKEDDTPEGTELDVILEAVLSMGRNQALRDANNTDIPQENPAMYAAEAKQQILQWHTTLVEQAVLEARQEELSLACHAWEQSPQLPATYLIDRTEELAKLKSQQAGKETK